MLNIVQVLIDQIDTVAAILEDASALQRAHGFRGWPVPFPRERLDERFRIGAVYLGLIDHTAVGTFSLQPFDPPFWGEQPPDALYLHGLAIRRDFAGQGVGRTMLGWAEAFTAAQGKPFLRLDTLADDPGICQYYERAGYTDCGTLWVGQFHARLYEKRVLVEDL